jgi:hypothetical protein
MFCADSLENFAVHPACRYSGNTRIGSAKRCGRHSMTVNDVDSPTVCAAHCFSPR